MTFWSKLLPSAAIVGAGMIIYGIIDIIGQNKRKINFTHQTEMCEICGITDDVHIWHGVNIEQNLGLKRLAYDPDSFAVTCKNCRNQTTASAAWQILQKKQT
tara:strand:- start:1688 stop:1993 length:306 start_codon:yes stop_codon:yes gene_type:complete